MPIKLFEDGEILDASDVNTYFMDQALVVFDSAAQRDAAFGGTVNGIPNEPALAEGRICYLKDDDTLYIYTGATWTAQLATIANGAVISAKLGSDLDLNGTTEIDEVLETVVTSASALTGTVQIYAKSGSVHYFTPNAATANWIWNITGDATPTTLTSMMDNGQSITFALFAKIGGTGFYPTSITVDGSAPASLRWFGGNVIAAGNPNSVDCYSITVIKLSTGIEVFASQSKFA